MHTRHITATGTAVLLLMVLTGCGADTQQAPTPSTSSAAPAPSADDATSSSAFPTPTDSPTTARPADTYTVAPATGPTVSLDQATYAIPPDWSVPDADPRIASTNSPDYLATLLSSSISLSSPVSLEEGPAALNKTAGYERDLPAQEPVVIAGQQWWHAAGMADSGTYVEAFGTTASSGNDVTMIFEFLDQTPQQRRTETLGSILASVTLS